MRLCDIEAGTAIRDGGRIGSWVERGVVAGFVGSAPRDDRLDWVNAVGACPPGVLRLVPAPLYRLCDATGRNVGVEGREDGVRIELPEVVVAFVLTLLRPSERRDCGLRSPNGTAVCERALGDRLLNIDVGDADAEPMLRYADGADGLDLRFSLTGVGESCISITQPFSFGSRLRPPSELMLDLLDFLLKLSCEECVERMEDEDAEGAGEGAAGEGAAFGCGGMALAPVLLVMLPIRIRGTRV